ncbi:hypothetical protein BV20DRAFT_1048651 [Pilatotrama ljubarskyi]|nr:hypothetical protein BV20DRAFT_1048651 [Pilatotrama ljubarskyi]
MQFNLGALATLAAAHGVRALLLLQLGQVVAPVLLTWGIAHVTLDGQFASQQQCWDGFQNIIDQCYGSKDGGIYRFQFNGNDARLDVNFCNCE